jgi:hypothetical protein
MHDSNVVKHKTKLLEMEKHNHVLEQKVNFTKDTSHFPNHTIHSHSLQLYKMSLNTVIINICKNFVLKIRRTM